MNTQDPIFLRKSHLKVTQRSLCPAEAGRRSLNSADDRDTNVVPFIDQYRAPTESFSRLGGMKLVDLHVQEGCGLVEGFETTHLAVSYTLRLQVRA